MDLKLAKTSESSGQNILAGDISKAEIVKLLDEIKPSAIVHTAAHPGGKSMGEPTINLETNVLGSMRIFEWSARNQCKILYLSSSIVYGEVAPVPIPETSVIKPGTIYGVAKAACEQWLSVLSEGYELDWVVLRPFSTYGVGHNPSLDQGIVNVMLTQMEDGMKLIVKGSLGRLRDLVHVSDATSAICRALEIWPSRQILNVCTGKATSVREMIQFIAEVRGIEFSELECHETAGTIGDPMYNVGDTGLAEKTIGFRSRISPKEGIAHLLSRRLSVRS